jgi:DNA-directed RNA polymerase subunit RPC12/RpoP
MIDRSALVSNSFESAKSFEKMEVWVVKCAECGKAYGGVKGTILFSNIEKALEVIAESRDWWLVRDCGVKVLCSECVQKFKDRMEDEVSGDVMILA